MSKAKTRARRQAVGFELNPARCCNCKHFSPPIHGVPAKRPYTFPTCAEMGFTVKPHSICDLWTGRDGETLE